MTKKLCIILALTLIILSFSSCGDRQGTVTTVNLSTLSDSYTITDSGTYDFSGKLTEGKIKVEADSDVTIILSGVEITNTDDEAIKIENDGKTEIRIADGSDNVLTGGGDAAINAKSSIKFTGGGFLSIVGSTKHGIECDTDITITGGNIKINSYEHGIKSESKIKVLGGNLDIYSETGKGIKAEKEFLAEDGSVTITTPQNEGLESKGALTINGGRFDITAGEDGINAGTSDSATTTDEPVVSDNSNAIPNGGEGTGAIPPEGAQPEIIRPEGGFPMVGEGEQNNNGDEPSDNRPQRGKRPVMKGEITGEAEFDVPPEPVWSEPGLPMRQKGQGGFGRVNEDSVITINGGYIRISCLGDGIDSNGSLSINGGTVIIDGPNNSGNGPLDSDGEMIINGATVLTASAKGMTQMPRSMTQGIITQNFETALKEGQEIVIMNTDKKIIAEHTVGKVCEMLIYTSPDVKMGSPYTIYVDGEEAATVTASTSIGSVGGRGGMKPDGRIPMPKGEKAEITNE